MKLSERLTRFVQGTTVVIALAMLMIGGFVYASPTSEELPQPSLYQDIVVSNSECAVYLEPSDYHSDDMYFSVANGAGEVVAGFVNFWNCVVHDQATCGFWMGGVCSLAAILVQVALLAMGWGAVLALVKGLSKPAIKAIIKKVVSMIKLLPSASVSINGTAYTFGFATLAGYLAGKIEEDFEAAIDFLLLTVFQQSRRICKCLICSTESEDSNA